MRALRTIRNYFFYSGIEKDEYKAVKKDAYISNYSVWRILHCVMVVVFGFLYISSLFTAILVQNRFFYMMGLIYSIFACSLFFILKKDSLIAQLIIYLSISLLFVFSCLITQNKPEIPATTFITFLLIAPMFMIDKPFFMTFELGAASAVFLIWMYYVKPYEIWQMDLINVIVFTLVGIVLNIIANSIRIREFVLTRKINIQKDLDDLTGLMNKGALTRAIGSYIEDESTYKGIMMMMDVDQFKSINDTYGHDAGDNVIAEIGKFLGNTFNDDTIAGRFGGDEFVVFIKDNDDPDNARSIAEKIISGAGVNMSLPDPGKKISVSIGIENIGISFGLCDLYGTVTLNNGAMAEILLVFRHDGAVAGAGGPVEFVIQPDIDIEFRRRFYDIPEDFQPALRHIGDVAAVSGIHEVLPDALIGISAQHRADLLRCQIARDGSHGDQRIFPDLHNDPSLRSQFR